MLSMTEKRRKEETCRDELKFQDKNIDHMIEMTSGCNGKTKLH